MNVYVVQQFLTVIVALFVVAIMVISIYGSPRTRALGLIGGGIWLVSYLISWIPRFMGLRADFHMATILFQSIAGIIGVGLMAAAAIVPVQRKTANRYGQPVEPNHQPYDPGQYGRTPRSHDDFPPAGGRPSQG